LSISCSRGTPPIVEPAKPESFMTWTKGLKLTWREAGPPHHHDDKLDDDVNKEVSLEAGPCGGQGASGGGKRGIRIHVYIDIRIY